MLTYKQLLQKCNRELLNKFLLERTLEDLEFKYPEEPKEKILANAQDTVTEGYGHVIETMINLEGKHPKYAIILDLVPEEKWKFAGQEETSPAYINVIYYNTRTEPYPEDTSLIYKEGNEAKYDKFIGFGLCKWEDYANCDIVISPDAAVYIGSANILEKVAVEILWEQTFHGFTEEKLIKFLDEIKERINLVKSGKIKTKVIKKKKGQKFDIVIPEDLLPLLESPSKKKKAKKKK